MASALLATHLPPGVSARAVAAVMRRPDLWLTAVRSAGRLRSDAGGVPIDYFRFRQQTQSGGTGNEPIEPHDLIDFLKWARGVRKVLG